MKRTHHIAAGWLLLLATLVVAGCGDGRNREGKRGAPVPEDREAKAALQGIWIDRETESVSFCIKGDSVYYPDTVNVPVRFFVREDTFFMVGADTAAYPIERRGRHIFHFRSATGETVCLVRSEDPNDSLYFVHRKVAALTYNEVVKKDTVVYHGGGRYHCYVYVNPSRLKVYKTSYTDGGIAVENIYYDNVIHICVYKGRECLFSRDYTRKSFTGLVPAGFLNQSILSNMVFSRADQDGCHFEATVCIPDGASCYMVDICVDYKGEASMNLLEY